MRLCSLTTKAVRILEVSEPGVLETLAISAAPSGKYCALLQRATLAGKEVVLQVAVVNLKVGQVVRTIRPPKELSAVTSVVDFGFSDEQSKSLVVVWGGKEPVIVTYRWYLDKVIGSVRLERSMVGAQFIPSGDTQLVALTTTSLHHLTQDLQNETYQSALVHEMPAVRGLGLCCRVRPCFHIVTHTCLAPAEGIDQVHVPGTRHGHDAGGRQRRLRARVCRGQATGQAGDPAAEACGRRREQREGSNCEHRVAGQGLCGGGRRRLGGVLRRSGGRRVRCSS